MIHNKSCYISNIAFWLISFIVWNVCTQNRTKHYQWRIQHWAYPAYAPPPYWWKYCIFMHFWKKSEANNPFSAKMWLTPPPLAHSGSATDYSRLYMSKSAGISRFYKFSHLLGFCHDFGWNHPADTRHSPNAVSKLVQRLRRCPNIEAVLG